MLINILKHPGEEFLVGILLPPSLLGRAPSRGCHGLFRRTADRVSLCLSLLSCSGFPFMVFPFCMTCPSP
ncbi:unnamed protein product, partial [Gulo gulo]